MQESTSNDPDVESPFIPNWLSLPEYVLEKVILQLDWPSTVICSQVCKYWNEFIKKLKIETRIEHNWFNSSPSLEQEYVRLEFHNNPSDTMNAEILLIGENITVIKREVKDESGKKLLKSQVQVTDVSHHDGESNIWTIDVSMRGACFYAEVDDVEVTETLIVLKCHVDLSLNEECSFYFLDIWSRKGRRHISILKAMEMDLCSKSIILIHDGKQLSTVEVKEDESLLTTFYTTRTTPRRIVEAEEIMIHDFKVPYALIETSRQDDTETKLVLYEMNTEKAKLEEKFCVHISGGAGDAADIVSNYITYCQRNLISVMDLLGNRILRVKADPFFQPPSIQSGKMMFFESFNEELAKLHVFDMSTVMENYNKNGELVCSSRQHESESSFKSRSISLEARYLLLDQYSVIFEEADKASVTIYTSSYDEMVVLKSKLSFWNGKESPM